MLYTIQLIVVNIVGATGIISLLIIAAVDEAKAREKKRAELCRNPSRPTASLFSAATCTLLGSGAVALIGLIADRRKTPSLIALASLFPLLVVLGIWSGKS